MAVHYLHGDWQYLAALSSVFDRTRKEPKKSLKSNAALVSKNDVVAVNLTLSVDEKSLTPVMLNVCVVGCVQEEEPKDGTHVPDLGTKSVGTCITM